MEKLIIGFNIVAFKKAAVFLATPTLGVMLLIVLWFLDFGLLKEFITSKNTIPAMTRIFLFISEIYLFINLYMFYDKKFPNLEAKTHVVIERVDSMYISDLGSTIAKAIKERHNHSSGIQSLEIAKLDDSQFLLTFIKKI